MSSLFRLPGATAQDAAVDAWLAEQAPELGAVARTWFLRMRRCGPDVRDTMHDGAPTACVQDTAFAYVAVFTAHVNVGFFHGADLEDPACLLRGGGRRMRHVKVKPGVILDDGSLEALIRAAYADIRRRLATERSTGTTSSASERVSTSVPIREGRTMSYQRVFKMKFSGVYPLYVQKAERKKRTKEEVDQIICWLTGYSRAGLQRQIERGSDFETFFTEAPSINPNASMIKGVVCGVRVEEIEDPLMQKIRFLDKLIDELAKGRAMDKILRH